MDGRQRVARRNGEGHASKLVDELRDLSVALLKLHDVALVKQPNGALVYLLRGLQSCFRVHRTLTGAHRAHGEKVASVAWPAHATPEA